MYAPYNLATGLKALEGIIRDAPPESAHWNEAQNRFQFIDRLLTECLGWERPQIAVEVSDDLGGRADYLLGLPPKAVLEAKKEARYFDVPTSGRRTLVRGMEPLLKSSKAFSEAVHQVIPYCAIQGTQIAVVCNGPQLVVFQAIIPGHSPLMGDCYFFDGLKSYVAEFPLLWKLLSPEGIAENYAYRGLALHRTPGYRLKPQSQFLSHLSIGTEAAFRRTLGRYLLCCWKRSRTIRSSRVTSIRNAIYL